jgi:hypothetical protein
VQPRVSRIRERQESQSVPPELQAARRAQPQAGPQQAQPVPRWAPRVSPRRWEPVPRQRAPQERRAAFAQHEQPLP